MHTLNLLHLSLSLSLSTVILSKLIPSADNEGLMMIRTRLINKRKQIRERSSVVHASISTVYRLFKWGPVMSGHVDGFDLSDGW